MNTSIEQSPQRYARIGGVLYLAIIALGLFGEAFVRGTLVVSGDATATASAIAASESLWRAGLAGDLLMHVFDLPVIVVLYLLLKPVSESLALLATFFNLIQTAVLVANKLNLLAPADGQLLIAEGSVVRYGRTLIVTRAEVFAVSHGRKTQCALMQQTIITAHGKKEHAAKP